LTINNQIVAKIIYKKSGGRYARVEVKGAKGLSFPAKKKYLFLAASLNAHK